MLILWKKRRGKQPAVVQLLEMTGASSRSEAAGGGRPAPARTSDGEASRVAEDDDKEDTTATV